MQRLQDKVAFITGAASGIGLATTKLFLEEGASVVMMDREEDALAGCNLDSTSGKVEKITADVTSQTEVEQAVATAMAKFGRIDIAVFNAGIAGANMPLEEFPVELFDEVLAVNMRGAWLGLRAVVPHMKRQQAGSIIFTSSIQGLAALAGTTAYTTSKHALVGMMKGAALELAPFNVRVNTVHPGYVETPMMTSIHEAVVPEAPESFQRTLSATVPMGRYAKPEEIARLMLFLGSSESSYSTGGCFTSDGGILAALPA